MEPRISIITLGVADLGRAVRFYRDGLGFPTTYKDGDGIAHFATGGARFGLYPTKALAEDISPTLSPERAEFSGITLAHNVRTREEVAATLALAEKAGATIVKQAQDVFWGGHSGYFRDPDGHFWEVAWGPMFQFAEDGTLLF